MSNNIITTGISSSINRQFELKVMKGSELKEKLLGSMDISETDLSKFYICKNDKLNPFIDEMIQKAALETSIVIINITKENKYELIDGFLKIFGTNSDNSDIIVKIFRGLDDIEYQNELYYCNLWKTKTCDTIVDFFDRGFMLSLYNRYKINLCELLDRDSKFIIKLIKTYFYENNLTILLNNRYFIQDMNTILGIYLNNIEDTEQKNIKTMLVKYTEIVGLIRTQFPDIVQEELREEMFNILVINKDIIKILKLKDIDYSSLKLYTYYELVDKLVPSTDLSFQELKYKYAKIMEAVDSFYKFSCEKDIDLFNRNISYFMELGNDNKAAIEILKKISKSTSDEFYYYDRRRRGKKCKETMALLEEMKQYFISNEELDSETKENIDYLINIYSKYLN